MDLSKLQIICAIGLGAIWILSIILCICGVLKIAEGDFHNE